MKNILIYTIAAVLLSSTACQDDERSFNLTPAIGFSVPFINVLEENTGTVEVGLSSNVRLTDAVTVEIGVTILGLEYGVDFTTEPAIVDNKITLTIDADDTAPGFTIDYINRTFTDATRKVYFDILSVNGNGLVIGQGVSSSFVYSINQRQLDPNQETIANVRALYTGTAIADIPLAKFIEGTVISSNDNVTGKNVFIQDHTGGIVLRFNVSNATQSAALKLVPGDLVRVPLKDVNLTAFNGLLQLGDGTAELGHDKITKIASVPLPDPIVVTVSELNTNAYQSMLVRVNNVSFAAANGTVTVTGNTTFSDGTASAIMRVESYAPFASMVLPSGNISVTGVAGYFNAAQILPMKASDIQ